MSEVVALLQELNLAPAKVAYVEAEMLKLEQAECAVEHQFGAGLYIRTVHLPAGIFAIGHEQLQPQYNVMLKGRVKIVQPDRTVVDLVAPCTYIGPPGRKIGYVVEDTIWQNVYSTEIDNADEAEAKFIKKSEGFLLHQEEVLQLEAPKQSEDREDFELVLAELGMTYEQFALMSDNPTDQVAIRTDRYRVCASTIHGQGIFLDSPAEAGEVIGVANIGGYRTALARYTNHAKTPNAFMQLSQDGNIYLVAKQAIKGRCGGMQSEEVTVDYRQALAVTAQEKVKVLVCQ